MAFEVIDLEDCRGIRGWRECRQPWREPDAVGAKLKKFIVGEIQEEVVGLKV
jgi:hypothetical protein